jgi:lipoprotein-anchoring transpeptidase ErfK/SrfK
MANSTAHPRQLVRLCGVVVLALCAFAATGRNPRRQHPTRQPSAAPLECGAPIAFQVLLDRQGFSPGQIDGKPGSNLTHALVALQQARKLTPTGHPDCDTWRALGGDAGGPAIVAYTITDADVNGPLTASIPHDLVQQATLPALGYTSALEKIAERFHAAPELLQALNRGARFAAGESIHVPAVQPFDPDAKPAPDPSAADITIQVSREESALRAMRADGSLVLFAPVTSGSVHDPLPIGDWKVTGIDWHPAFHYNPDLFWDAKPNQTKATIKPGPNNPVGVVWIGISREHYGLHGSPEPGQIGHTQSHGCVRLTNWDAVRVAALVKPGTTVLFR